MDVTGKRIAVLGDMLELGEREEVEHRRVGRKAGRLGVEYLLTYGERARAIGEASESGIPCTMNRRTCWQNTSLNSLLPVMRCSSKGRAGWRWRAWFCS